MLRAAALSLLCVLGTLTAAGCGESGSGGEGEPGSLVPAGAALYVEAAVQPEGELRDDALAAARKLLRTDDPAAKMRDLIDKELAADGLSWERDFAPWLGEDAGVWASDLGRAEPSFALIAATTDAEAAKAALAKFEKTSDSGPYTARSYHGIDYKVDSEGMANGVIDDFVVVATEGAFKRTADTRDGDKLVDTDRYKEAVGELEEERLGHLYLDGKSLVDVMSRDDPDAARQLEQFESLFQFDKLGPMAVSFEADGDGLLFDALMTGLPEGPLRELATLTGFGGTELLGDFPADAWGAYALPRVGESAQSLFKAFAGPLGGVAAAAQVKKATGLDLQEDIFSWIGDVGLFVRGTDMASLDGAVVIDATDDDKATAAFGKLVALIGRESGVAPEAVKIEGAASAFAIDAPDAEKRIILARGEGRVVGAYGEAAAAAALRPEVKLGDSDTFGGAQEVLGDMDATFLLSVPDAIRLADSTGATDAEFDKVRPYLEALGVVAGGGEADDDRVRSRFGVTLK
jgi:Protein of unknown function (DUF3352)